MSITVKDIPLLQGLSPSELADVKSCLIEKTFKKNEILFHEGNTCERIFIVREGRVKVFRTASTGREQTLETLAPGDTCACNPGQQVWSCSSSAQAATDCRVWFLSRDNYVRLVQTNAKLSHTLNKLFAERLKCFGNLIEEVSLKDSKKRLVKFLLDMLNENKTAMGSEGALSLPFTREEIAQRLGVARETLVRQLYHLENSKLIAIKSHQVVILEKEGLKKLLQ